MEHSKFANRERMRDRLMAIPGKIISLHGNDNITEFVLNDLCHKNCFNLKKAAYFIDNPDFNHFKGVAGYDAEQLFNADPDRCWLDPQGFSNHMRQASFNQRVRKFSSDSPKYTALDEKNLIKAVSDEFSFIHPEVHSWHLKNDNHGLLIFELANQQSSSWTKDDLAYGVHLLSFCPIF